MKLVRIQRSNHNGPIGHLETLEQRQLMSTTLSTHLPVAPTDSTQGHAIVMSLDVSDTRAADASTSQQQSGDGTTGESSGGEASAAARTVRVRYLCNGHWRWRVVRRA